MFVMIHEILRIFETIASFQVSPMVIMKVISYESDPFLIRCVIVPGDFPTFAVIYSKVNQDVFERTVIIFEFPHPYE